MSGDIGKSLRIDTMPPWLMKPCCMLTPSTDASSPDWRPPFTRASNASLPWPVLTPGMSSANVAAARGPLVKSSGRLLQRLRRDAVLLRGRRAQRGRAADDLDLLLLRADRQRDVEPELRSEGTSTSDSVTSWKPGFKAWTSYLDGDRLRNVYAPSAPDTVGPDGLVGRDVAKRQRRIRHDGAAGVLNDADDGAIHGLCPRQPRDERSREQQDDYW